MLWFNIECIVLIEILECLASSCMATKLGSSLKFYFIVSMVYKVLANYS